MSSEEEINTFRAVIPDVSISISRSSPRIAQLYHDEIYRRILLHAMERNTFITDCSRLKKDIIRPSRPTVTTTTTHNPDKDREGETIFFKDWKALEE